MLVQEVQDGLVATLVLLADLRVLKVGPRGHPAVDLGREGLDELGDFQVVAVGVDVGDVLVLGGQQGHGDRHLLGVVGVQHGRVALHRGAEGLVVLARRQVGDLAAPAVAQDGPRVAAVAGRLAVGVGDDVGDLGQRVGRGGLGLEEVGQLLLVLLRLGRVPRDVGGAALEPVGHEHPVLLLRVGVGEDVSALEGLREEAEDVWDALSIGGFVIVERQVMLTVDDQDGLVSGLGAGNVCCCCLYIFFDNPSCLRMRSEHLQVFRPPMVLYSPLVW